MITKRLPTATYVLPTGTLGTATEAVVVRAGGDQGAGYRAMVQAGATGEVEWLLSEPQGAPAGRVVASWTEPADERPRPIIVPRGRMLSVRRPAATAGLVGDVIVSVTEEVPDGSHRDS